MSNQPTGTFCRIFVNKAGDIGILSTGEEIILDPGFGYTIGLVAGTSATWSFVDNFGTESGAFDSPFTFPNLRGPFIDRPRTTLPFIVKCTAGTINIIQHTL